MRALLFLLLVCIPFFAYAEDAKNESNVTEISNSSNYDTMSMETEALYDNTESDGYVIDTVEIGSSQDFTYEATLHLYMGGYLSINDISPLINGDWIIIDNYIKFTISESVMSLLSRKDTLLPIGTASDGRRYYLKLVSQIN